MAKKLKTELNYSRFKMQSKQHNVKNNNKIYWGQDVYKIRFKPEGLCS